MEKTASGVAWTALIVAIISLVLGWTAFNRSGTDLGDMVQQEAQEVARETEQNYQQVEQATRRETSEVLFDAAADVSVDSDPNTAGE